MLKKVVTPLSRLLNSASERYLGRCESKKEPGRIQGEGEGNMTIQEKQDSTLQKVTNFGREYVARMWETLRGTFRDLRPPRAWLRAFIIAYLGTRLVLFLIDGPVPV